MNEPTHTQTITLFHHAQPVKAWHSPVGAAGFTDEEESAIKATQMAFYAEKKAGCLFAAIAAKRPERYGWSQMVLPVSGPLISRELLRATEDPSVSMLSLIFPSVTTIAKVRELISVLETTKSIFSEEPIVAGNVICIRLRAKIGENMSWISGFGPFEEFRRFIIPAVKRNGFGSLRQRSGEDAKPTPKTLRKRRLPNDRFHHRWGTGASHS